MHTKSRNKNFKPPFNLKAMDIFIKKKNIEMKKIPPFHPSSNPVETLMHPLGKTINIAHLNDQPEKKYQKVFYKVIEIPHMQQQVSLQQP